MDVLDEDDLDLINEARGIPSKHAEEEVKDKKEYVKAKDATDLQRGLFTGDSSDEDEDDCCCCSTSMASGDDSEDSDSYRLPDELE